MIICPNLNNKEVAQQFQELVNVVGEVAAYDIWSQNEGNPIDRAPNGAPSKLFTDLLSHFNGDRVLAIQAKAKTFSTSFKTWFGDWTNQQDVNQFSKNSIDTNKVDIEEIDKPWKNDSSKINKTLRIYIKDQHDKGYFELVKDEEYGMYSVHFKTNNGKVSFTDAKETTSAERKILFKELINAIPNGAKVSTWGSISEDGIKGLYNIGRDMIKVRERTVTSKINNDNVTIPIFQKQSNVSKVVDENGEPKILYHTVSPSYDASFGIFNTTDEKGNQTMIYFTDDLDMSKSYAKS